MSELRLRSFRILFAWQLLWLLVQAAPIRRAALDPVLLTSIPTRPTKPWLLAQQLPSQNIYNDPESSLYVTEASALTTEFPEKMESSTMKVEVSTEPANDMLKRSSQPGIPADNPKKIDLSPFQQETLGQPIAEADATVLQPLGDLPGNPEVTGPHPETVQAQKSTSDVTLLPLHLELTIIPKPTVEEDPTAVTPPTAPTKHPTVTFLHPEPIQAQQQSPSDSTPLPLDLEFTITPKPDAEEHPTAVRPPIALPKHLKLMVPHPETVRAQQHTSSDTTVSPLNLKLTVTPKPDVEEHLRAVTSPTAPPKHPEVTVPHPEAVQVQQPTSSDIAVPPLDMEFTVTPVLAMEEHSRAVTSTTAPSMHPEVTVPYPGPAQAQQPTSSDSTIPPLDVEFTESPILALEKYPTSVIPPTVPPKHPEVTVPHPEAVQVQQPTSSDITVPPLDLEFTITPTLAMEEHSTAVIPPIAPSKHPEVTVPYPGPVQPQQPTSPDITIPPLDLEFTVTPILAMEEHSRAVTSTTAPSKHPELTVPYPGPVQAQQPTSFDSTILPLDVEFTESPILAMEKYPTPVIPPTALPKHPEVTVPHPEAIQVQQPTSSDITVPPLDLEFTITPILAMEEHSTAVTPPIAPSKHPEVTVPHPGPDQAQQPTSSDITIPPLDVEFTITPILAMEEHSRAVTSTTAPSMHPEVTVPYPGPVQPQQPTSSDTTVPPLDLEFSITPILAMEEHSTAVTPPIAPSKHPEVTVPYPGPVQAQQPTSSDITVPPLDVELTEKPILAMEKYPTSVIPPTAPPKHPEVTVQHPETIQVQQPTSSDTTVPPLDLEFTITPTLPTEERSAAVTSTTAPSKHPEVTIPHPEAVQPQQHISSDITVPPLNLELTVTQEPGVEHPTATLSSTAPLNHPEGTVLVQYQQPTWGEATVQDSDVELFRTQQPGTSKSGPPMNEQKLPMDICELCTCYNHMLSCTGLSPEQKLRSVPVLYPNIYNHTFTVVNFQGNSISYIDESSWKSYHSLEKLILRGNNLKELRKDSLEGLISLQYLDVSSNKIQHIERNTFESLPLLQYLNLQNNLITEVRFGTFQAWHGMRSLHRLILSHNPLTTVKDSYLFHLPTLQFLDMGTTQVSLTTVERILMTTLKLKKLILPSHLVCCLCQFQKNTQAVSKTVKLNCDSDCLTNTRCDKELHLGRTEDSFMKILQGREENNCPELTIEPEGASSGESRDSFAALTNILSEFLSEQEAVKVSKVDWDTGGWKKGTTEAQGEEDEHKSRELTQEVPGYGYKYKLILAAPVIVVASFFIVLCMLIVVCHKNSSEEGKQGRDFSGLGYGRSLEEGGSRRRQLPSFWGRYSPYNIMCNRNVEQNLYPKDGGAIFIHIKKGEATVSTAKGAILYSVGEERVK